MDEVGLHGPFMDPFMDAGARDMELQLVNLLLKKASGSAYLGECT